MLHCSTINENPGWKNGKTRDDQNDADLSPQMIRTTANLTTIKNLEVPDFHEEFELVQKPEESLSSDEDCCENGRKTWFVFENMYSFLKQTDKNHSPNEDKSMSFVFDIISDILSDIENEDGDDDTSSTASSSCSAVFYVFEDLSMLTTDSMTAEDSYWDDSIDGSIEYEIEYSEVNMHVFEEMPRSAKDKDQSGGKDIQCVVYSLTQQHFVEKHQDDKNSDSLEDRNKTDVENISKDLKDIFLIDLVVQSCYDNGFSPNDELRMA